MGSRGEDGTRRHGVDVERVLSIDEGALRIQPLVEAGWNRACLSYGPFERRAGLVLGISMVNGHNTSQSEQLPDSLDGRLRRWLIGSETMRIRERALKWLTSGRVRRVLRQFRWWARTAKGRREVEPLDENMAVGWFPRVDSHPMHEGSAIVMHAMGPENGELWLRLGTDLLPVVHGVQNLHIYYVVALRHDSAVYYAASVPRAGGFAPYPMMRPLGVDIGSSGATEVWASVHQSLLGQIGFRLDTRVYGIGVAELREWRQWCGGAMAADKLDGEGAVAGSGELFGRSWEHGAGSLRRSGRGAVTDGMEGACGLHLPSPIGLVRCGVRHDGGEGNHVALRWRMRDTASYWEVRLGLGRSELSLMLNGSRELLASADRSSEGPGDLQIVDDGRMIVISLNGRRLFERQIEDDRLADATAVAIALQDGGGDRVSAGPFEAHARAVALPRELDFGPPWFRTGSSLLIEDDFSGEAGGLQGRRTTLGGKFWQRLFGAGYFDVTGAGSVKVRASRENPAPGRVMYAVDWDCGEFADIEVTITPPGTSRGEGENGIAGIVAWQDDDNYLTVNCWTCDAYAGSSISCFFRIRGWEDLYDAIWSNVGSRIRHGHPYRMRLAFDGMHYIVFVDDEPVVCRALTDVYADCRRLAIRRVGIITNWEWGRDTGSEFRNFRVRS